MNEIDEHKIITDIVNDCLRDFCFSNLISLDLNFGKYFTEYLLFINDNMLKYDKMIVHGGKSAFDIGDYHKYKNRKLYEFEKAFEIEVYFKNKSLIIKDVSDFENCVSHLKASLKREIDVIYFKCDNPHRRTQALKIRVIYD